jgi:outer membrane protein assembly factor BamB
LADIATNCIADNEYSGPARTLLAALNARLGKGNWRVVSAVESNYRLSVAVAGSPDEKAQIEFNYDKHGLVSSVRPLMCSSLDAVETVRRFLQ